MSQGNPGNTVRVNGIELYYEIEGAGEPLLLLHGGGGCLDHWVHAGRDQFVSEYMLIKPDARGHGRSSNPGRTITHRQCALDTLALLDHLGIKRCRAIGLSMGGNILLHMATLQPDRLEAMVVVSATMYFPEQARKIMRQIPAPADRADPSRPSFVRWTARFLSETIHIAVETWHCHVSLSDPGRAVELAMLCSLQPALSSSCHRAHSGSLALRRGNAASLHQGFRSAIIRDIRGQGCFWLRTFRVRTHRPLRAQTSPLGLSFFPLSILPTAACRTWWKLSPIGCSRERAPRSPHLETPARQRLS